jgi:hypothetical protein
VIPEKTKSRVSGEGGIRKAAQSGGFVMETFAIAGFSRSPQPRILREKPKGVKSLSSTFNGSTARLADDRCTGISSARSRNSNSFPHPSSRYFRLQGRQSFYQDVHCVDVESDSFGTALVLRLTKVFIGESICVAEFVANGAQECSEGLDLSCVTDCR